MTAALLAENQRLKKQLQTIELYQSMKDYMCEEKISLGGIIARSRANRDILNVWLQLRVDRNNICHPEDEKISSDGEFIKKLKSFGKIKKETTR